MGSEGNIKIVSDQRVTDSIFLHKKISLGRRSFGLLVGNVIEEGRTSITYIEDIFPIGRLSKAKGILADSNWMDIRSKALEKHSGKEIVGWYGLRNGWGAMMLEEDQYIHKNYFKGQWQVMYLLDDKGGFRNFYTWEEGKLRQYKQAYQEEELKEFKDDTVTVSKKGGYPKWICAIFVVAILLSISYPRYIRPLMSKRQPIVSSSGQEELELGIDEYEEVIKGLEDALEEKAQELEDAIQKLEEKEEEVEELKRTIKDNPQSEDIQDSSTVEVYQLQAGDTLSGISEKFYETSKYSEALGMVNRVSDHKGLRIGDYVVVPPLDVIEDIHSRNVASESE